jgi:hypothetical protein
MLEIVRDVAVRDPLQRGKVEPADPVLVDEPAQKVGDHLRMREKELVAVIVIRHFDASGNNTSFLSKTRNLRKCGGC